MVERKIYKVAVKVASQEGFCSNGHKVGDEWVIGYKTPKGNIEIVTPEGMCFEAFLSLLTAICALAYGGSFPWEADPDVITNVACPDAKNPVVFKLRRIRED